MMENEKTTALIPSVGADGGQPPHNSTNQSVPHETCESNPPEENIEEMREKIRRMNDPHYLHTVSMTELYQTAYKSRPPVIDGLLYSGAYILAGAPKIGKSFLVAQLAYHVSTGQRLWGYEVHSGTVLYLAPEDDFQRIQSRMFTTYLKSTDKKQSLRYNILAAGSEVIRVKVEIKMTETAKEPYAVIFTNEMTEAVRQAAAILEGAVSNKAITVTDNERIFVLRPEELYMLRVENERAAVYTRTKRFDSGRRLYEFEDMLGVSFMRISKSVLINLQYLECVEPTLGGLMMVTLKNGCKECISRKYLPAFKKYLGL